MKARVLVSDPAWKFVDSLPGNTRGAEKNYPCLDVWEIQRFPLPGLEPDAILFLWRLSSMVEEAYAVCRAWGFVPKTEIVWSKTVGEDTDDKEAKDAFGMGRYTRGAHETCIVATRGKMIPHIKDKGIRSIFRAPIGKHSEKPEAFFQLVEKLVDGPYVEIFSRKPRAGWTVYGNEIPGGSVYTPPAATPPSVDGIFKSGTVTVELSVGGVSSKTTTHVNGKKAICSTCGLPQFVLPNGWDCGNGHFVPLPPNSPKPSAEERTVDIPFEHAADVAPAAQAGARKLGDDPTVLVTGEATNTQLVDAVAGDRDKDLVGKPMNFDLSTPAPTVKSETVSGAAKSADRCGFTDPTFRQCTKEVGHAELCYFGAATTESVLGEMPFENFSKIAMELQVRAVRVSLTDVSGMTPLQRGTAWAWIEQGGKENDRPEFLDRFLVAAVTEQNAALPDTELVKKSDAGSDPWEKAKALIISAETSATVEMASEVAVVSVAISAPVPVVTEPPKKKRGRPSKADIAAREAAKALAAGISVETISGPQEASSHPPSPAPVSAPAGAREAGSSSAVPDEAAAHFTKWHRAAKMNDQGIDPIDENGFFTEAGA